MFVFFYICQECVNLAINRTTTHPTPPPPKKKYGVQQTTPQSQRDVKDKVFYSHGLPFVRALIPRHFHHPYLRNNNEPAISTVRDVRTPHKMSGHHTKCQGTILDVRTPYKMSGHHRRCQHNRSSQLQNIVVKCTVLE